MEVVYGYGCGLDIHKRTVVARVVVPGPGKQPHKEIRTFNTMTAGLLELADWLTAHRVTHVALESTGVYWKPARNVLESSFTLLLVKPGTSSRCQAENRRQGLRVGVPRRLKEVSM
jgi:transposase